MLPPTRDTDGLKVELRLVPKRLREDAAQEAWLAYLSGRDPKRAVNNFIHRERRREKRWGVAQVHAFP